MSVYNHDVVTRARIVRERLAELRAHQTEMRRRLHALALRGGTAADAVEPRGHDTGVVHDERIARRQ